MEDQLLKNKTWKHFLKFSWTFIFDVVHWNMFSFIEMESRQPSTFLGSV